MQIPWQNLKNLPVMTATGQKIGVILGICLDTNTQAVAKYEVQTTKFGLLKKNLLIAPQQVISLDLKQMVVKDTLIWDAVKKQSPKARLAFSSPSPEIEMSQRD